jgi:hypothetical protein
MDFRKKILIDETFEKLKDRNVKDLYWLLFSGCPINQNHPVLEKIPFFPEDILEDWRLGSSEYFMKLDQKPGELRHFLDRPKNKRLGFYAEALLSFFFQTFSPIELLLQNYQIIDNKKTLGEVDFIIKWNNRVIHIECAVKFYLCNHSKDVNDLHSWIGPACKDDLGRKIEKVKEQQLPMIHSSKMSSELSSDEVESYLFLKGKLFVNQEISCDWINNEMIGKYNMLNEINNSDGLHLLTKPYWMSIMIEKTPSDQSTFFSEENLRKRAELVMKTGSNPFFIVPKNWPF